MEPGQDHSMSPFIAKVIDQMRRSEAASHGTELLDHGPQVSTWDEVVERLQHPLAETLPWVHDVIPLPEEQRSLYGFRYDPEPWQLAMADAVDKGKSMLVLAPTSSGKTWAAEYAARKVLREQEGTVVLVQPTNALVNQTYVSMQALVAAEARLGAYNRNSVGYFTRDTRQGTGKDCRILVTNPACLEHLLLSQQDFDLDSLHGRLRWVVFDEIHCIGDSAGEGNSETLERLLCMVDCPVLCLSATLANEHQFSEWLVKLKQIHQTSLQRRRSQLSLALSRGSTTVASGEREVDDTDVIEVIRHRNRATALHFYQVIAKRHPPTAIESFNATPVNPG